MRSARLGLWAFAGVLACGSEPAPVRKGFELRIESATIHAVDGVVVDQSAVRSMLREATLLSESFVDPANGPVPVLSTQVRLGEVAGADGGRVLRVELAAEVPAGHQAVLGKALEATIELERRDGTLVAEQDVPIALARGVSVLDAKLQLVAGSEADAVRLLGAADPEIVVIALEKVARQRWRAVSTKVAELLTHEDERVVAAAVECLGTVGGPEHAAALVRHVRLADTDQARRLYDTLASVGGEEARGFLEFAARNEDDPEMADAATRALGQLDRGGPVEVASEPAVALRGHRP